MNNAEENTSELEDGQTLDTISLSNLVGLLKKLVHLNGQVLTLGEAVTLTASELHSSEPDELTRHSLRLLISCMNGSTINTLNLQSNLTSILSRLLVQGTSTIKSEGENNE